MSLALAAVGCGGYVFRTVRQQEEQAAFRSAQARTMELARAQAEQAARAAEMEADAETVAEAPAPADTVSCEAKED